MTATFNVVEGSQLQRVMDTLKAQEAAQKLEAESGVADFMISNFQNQASRDASREQISQSLRSGVEKENQSNHSFGTGSFTTNTFNAKLKNSNGMEILKYIQSENFGKYGESMKLIDTIQVSLILNLSNILVRLLSGIHKQTISWKQQTWRRESKANAIKREVPEHNPSQQEPIHP